MIRLNGQAGFSYDWLKPAAGFKFLKYLFKGLFDFFKETKCFTALIFPIFEVSTHASTYDFPV
jgi:hypothetical protein